LGRQTPIQFNQFRQGMLLELESPLGTAIARIEDVAREQIVARLESPLAGSGRARVRTPLDGTLLSATVRVSCPDLADPLLVVIDRFTTIERIERRLAIRLREPVRTSVRLESSEGAYRILPALNISARGVLLGWPAAPDIALGERLEIVLALDDVTLHLSGDVVRVDGEVTAIRFDEIPDPARDASVAYIFRREIQRKLVDDPFLDVE